MRQRKFIVRCAVAAQVDDANAEHWDEAYLKMLREFGSVDQATAHYLKEMVTTDLIGGCKIFRLPVDDEIETFAKHGRTVKGELKRVINEKLPSIGHAANLAPEPILTFIFVHESGAKHVGRFAGKTFVKMGIDWPNKATSNASFHETLTPGPL